MPALPHCPQCQSEYTYEDGEMYVCPECGHEWLKKEWSKQAEADNNDEGFVIRDVNGAVLKNGDSVTVIKDLKIKGSSSVIKVGTKIKIYVCSTSLITISIVESVGLERRW